MFKKLVILLVVLCFIVIWSTPLIADENEVTYELKISLKYNSVTFSKAMEIQKQIEVLAGETCTAKIELNKNGDNSTAGIPINDDSGGILYYDGTPQMHWVH